MYKKSILNEYSFILPKKLVVSDAELYKRRKENLSVLPNYINYAIPSNWFGYLKVSKIFLAEDSLKTLRSLTIALSERDVSEILSEKGLSSNEKFSVSINGISTTSDKFIIKSFVDNDWNDWNIEGKVSGFVESINESIYGKIIIIKLSLPYETSDDEIMDALERLFGITNEKFLKGLS